jgi:hypothetical protein
VCVCVCVSVSGVEIQTIGPILTKFVMGAYLYKGQVIGYVLVPGADPWGQGALNRVRRASTASTVRLGKNLMKQNMERRSILVGSDHIFGPVIWIWKDVGPMYYCNHG